MSFDLTNITHAYAGAASALEGVRLSAAQGERIAIIGPSGAGKTTLLRILGAALRPQSGEVRLLGQAPWTLSAGALKRLRSEIGTVHQAPPLPPRQRVVTAIQAGRLGSWSAWKALASLAYPADAAGVRAELARLDLTEKLYARCDELSGGQLQRVGIARVLYQQPALILADEPVSAMDPALAQRTVQLLVDEAARRDATLVASLHAVDLALNHFPRVVGVRDGRIHFDLPAAQVSDALLRELYASEGGELPVFAAETRANVAVEAPDAIVVAPPCV
jgi:phosphonate transport system ATP-binding protein